MRPACRWAPAIIQTAHTPSWNPSPAQPRRQLEYIDISLFYLTTVNSGGFRLTVRVADRPSPLTPPAVVFPESQFRCGNDRGDEDAMNWNAMSQGAGQ
jgi:hypothetical protein